VTRLEKTKTALKDSQQEMKAVINTVMDGIITIDETGQILSMNPAVEQMFGYAAKDVVGRNVSMLMPEPDHSQHDTYLRRYRETGQSRIINAPAREVNACRRNGDIFPIEISISEMRIHDIHHFVASLRDISERKTAEEKIRSMALYDQLTGLANRFRLYDRFSQGLAMATRNKRALAVLFMDLDGFKQVNDTLGHNAGDELLKQVAERLLACVRTTDTVARVGGDEFVIVLTEVDGRHGAGLIAGKVLDALSGPFQLGTGECHLCGSVGIAMFPEDGEDIDELVKCADNAMYLAKRNRKSHFSFYKATDPG
jgi:diguanylate cyclase (GGDEF)-like protein/PAS domain S-box-containing protein